VFDADEYMTRLHLGAALETSDLCRSHRGAQIGILACAFHHPTPARITGDIDHRCKRPLNSRSTGLRCCGCLYGSDHFWIPRCCECQRYWKDGAISVYDIQSKQQWDMLRRLYHSNPLQSVDRLRIAEGRHRPQLSGADLALERFASEIERLSQLADLLLESHFRQQGIRRVGRDRTQ